MFIEFDFFLVLSAPLGLTVRAHGHKKIEGAEFNKHFGVSLEKLDSDDLFYFLTLLAIKHDLYTFQKGNYSLNLFRFADVKMAKCI